MQIHDKPGNTNSAIFAEINSVMKFKVEIEINAPLEQVVNLFDNTDNMYKWMEGLQSFEPISGIPGQEGAKSRLVFKNGNQEIELIETITKRNLPSEFTGTYETKGMVSTVKNSFVKLADNKTKYTSDNEFQMKGFMKLIGMLFPGLFKKQSMKYLIDFKKFVESTV